MISPTVVIIRKPTKISAGAVAKPGIAQNIGARNIDKRKSRPVTTDARPVLAPAATPAELSTKVVVVDVPRTAPALVATASARSACLILGSLPSSSSMSALVATPISVPKVSNISTKRNANMIIMKLMIPTLVKSALNTCPKVSERAEKSVVPKVGYSE